MTGPSGDGEEERWIFQYEYNFWVDSKAGRMFIKGLKKSPIDWIKERDLRINSDYSESTVDFYITVDQREDENDFRK